MAAGEELTVEAGAFPSLRARVERTSRGADGRLTAKFRFSLAPPDRERLIVRLYTGDYSQEIHRLETRAVFWGIWKRAFGRISTELP